MVNKDIKELSEKILDDKEMDKINRVIGGIGSGDKESSLKELAEVLGMMPKRPLYYISHAIFELPGYGTRNVIKYAGDYIDQLVRFTLEDKRFFSRWFSRPLGANIEKLKKYINIDLYNDLLAFNKIYAQAKHVYNHDEDKSFFNYKDAVNFIYISKEMSQKLLPLSGRAREYNNGGEIGHDYNPVD